MIFCTFGKESPFFTIMRLIALVIQGRLLFEPILSNKELSITKMAIAERNLDVFDCHNIDFGNRKRCFWQSKTKFC